MLTCAVVTFVAAYRTRFDGIGLHELKEKHKRTAKKPGKRHGANAGRETTTVLWSRAQNVRLSFAVTKCACANYDGRRSDGEGRGAARRPVFLRRRWSISQVGWGGGLRSETTGHDGHRARPVLIVQPTAHPATS